MAASNLLSENLKQAKAAITQEKAEDFFLSILPAAGVLTAAFFVGAIAGIGIPRLIQPPLDPSAPRQLTLEEANALQWVKSDEGRFARENNGVEWGLFDVWTVRKRCQRIES